MMYLPSPSILIGLASLCLASRSLNEKAGLGLEIEQTTNSSSSHNLFWHCYKIAASRDGSGRSAYFQCRCCVDCNQGLEIAWSRTNEDNNQYWTERASYPESEEGTCLTECPCSCMASCQSLDGEGECNWGKHLLNDHTPRTACA
mmetsp:Transcript_84619/g.149768  ORF Transcript_84619/g.149768 Transcript_84619/m.149768 type:complete len:145 (+) Transcript_84619:41-475(+)